MLRDLVLRQTWAVFYRVTHGWKTNVPATCNDMCDGVCVQWFHERYNSNLRIKRSTRGCPSASRGLRDPLQLNTRVIAVAHAGHNRQTTLECSPHEVISSAFAYNVLHIHAAALPDSVRPVLSLHHDPRRPVQLREYDGCGSSERDTGAHSRDAQ